MIKYIKSTDKAYAAGYIDGDGCFYLGKCAKKFISSVTIVSTDKVVLKWFKEIFGGTISNTKQINFQKVVNRLIFKKRDGLYLTQNIHCFLVEKYDEAIEFIVFNTFPVDKLKHINNIKQLKNSTNLISKSMPQEFKSIRNTINPTENDFAYLAGFIDAECCLCIQKYRSKDRCNFLYKIQLQCNNTKAPVFKWLLQRFGGHLHFIDRNSLNPNHRNQLSWRLSSAALANILSKILPFLKYKKPVCEELIKFSGLILPNGGARHTDAFRLSYAAILQEKERIVQKVHILNLKGTNKHLSG